MPTEKQKPEPPADRILRLFLATAIHKGVIMIIEERIERVEKQRGRTGG